MSIAEKLGFLFEVGFNIGILADIQYQKYPNNFGDLYVQDLQQLKLPKMVNRMVQNPRIISSESQKNLERWSQYFILKGFLAGLNFFREYIKSTGWNQKQKKPEIEILYYQCCFHGNNSFGTNNKDKFSATQELLSQLLPADFLNSHLNRYIHQYLEKKGEFLQADTLMLLRYRKDLRITCVDLSIFSVQSAEDLVPLDHIEEFRRMLMREIKHIRSKSVFSKLRIDTGNTQDSGFEFSSDLKRFFTAFKRKDKETTKLIQAGAYAESFYNFLRQETQIIQNAKSILFNIVGYSDRNISTFCLRPENLNILTTCAEIYKKEYKDKEIKTARREVLDLIQRKAVHSFINGRDFIQELSTKPLNLRENSITEILHQEKLNNFVNSIDIIPNELAAKLGVKSESTLRDAHAELIQKALMSNNTLVFLTGNPGIGKTTAITNFIKSHLEEGFLLFYVSPRTQVNLDLIHKFKSENYQNQELFDDRLFCINANSILIQENGNNSTVRYYSNQHQDDFTSKNVRFINHNSHIKPRQRHQENFDRRNIDTIEYKTKQTAGVLNSISQGIYALIDGKISNNIIATVSTQSLKITPNGADTLRHLEKIFKSAYSTKKGVNSRKMQEISQRIKHLFIMIDEITGDDGGVNFLKGINQFVAKYQLTNPEYGFNTKIIVADASIVEQEVIKQHLSQTSPEPDKIYFRLAKSQAEPLSIEHFKFKNKSALTINANSYPASSLNITYKVFIQSIKFNQNDWKIKRDNELSKAVDAKISADIKSFLENSTNSQLLVYIQDKRRLKELIEKIKKSRKNFQEYTDYLEIHASLSDENREKIDKYKQDVKIVFMTSSASRGLSFPKAKNILVEIPHFQIEKNLMEVIQVIYRARGQYQENGKKITLDNQEKQIIFYLSDSVTYYPKDNDTSPEDYDEERKLFLEESLINLLDILLILKLSIMTRIVGAGNLAKKNFLIIPIGGKSISTAGNSFSEKITNLIRELKNEHNRHPEKQSLQFVYSSLTQILREAEFTLPNSDSQNTTYISLIDSFKTQLLTLFNRLDKLLDFGNIETGHLTGNLLVVPIYHQKLEETYQIGLEEQIRKFANDELFKKMWAISKSQDYPPNLKSAMETALEFIKLLKGDKGNIDTTQWFEQNSQNLDQYYAVPLFVFMSQELISKYFKQEPIIEEEKEFRTLLSRYVQSLYLAYNTLPIGRKYREFPFIVFRSYSLGEMREKIYSDRYLLTSNELNILNLIICRK
ncbi:MAG: helicase [Okeania sp. SIO2C9]|uniref:helicase-related protein n=1 Tax=Okeania sp. SIO2C9 TaxID=2607791 RepID=UPI0013C1CEE3|nr:helicase-related protein [Okeania sp. SIO2C9]NEQ77907.1 helicase [Okeania sp. SIO2C9]